jgi:hypothetical protein
MKERAIYTMVDVQGTDVVPAYVDCLTGFTLVTPGTPKTRHSLQTHLHWYRQELGKMRERATQAGRDWIPGGSCQYDDSAFMEARGRNEAPTQVLASDRREIDRTLRVAWSHSPNILGNQYILWGTMNNWAEGTTVLPTKRRSPQYSGHELGHYGFGHLRALRDSLKAN